MRYFSTFSGIGGFELGIIQSHDNRSNIRNRDADIQEDLPDTQEQQDGPTCVGFSEVDKYAIQTYQKNFPNHKNYGDITRIDTATLPDFDCFVGGFPCQSFSIAGKRGGFLDTRGTLFFECSRIIKDKRPKTFVLENVKGLLSHEKGQTFKTIVRTLTELGYCVEWQVLNSKNFGVPQNRERVFIIGHLGGIPRQQVFPIGGTGEKVIEQINQPKHSNDRVYSEEGISPTLNTMQGGNRQQFIAMTEKRTEEAKKIRRETNGRDFSPRRGKYLSKRDDNIGNCVTAVQGKEHLLTNDAQIRRLTPLECERLQGFPDGWTEGVSDSQRYKQCGNAVTVNVIEAIFIKLLKTV